MGRLRAGLCVTAVTAMCGLALACNALTGVGDLQEGAVATDGGTRDGALLDAPASIPDVGNGQVDADAQEPVDTGPPPPCPSAGRSCVPVTPDGWEGPFLVYNGERVKAPACPSEMDDTDDANIGTPQGAVHCSDCRCMGPQGVTCTAILDEFNGTACGAFSASEDLTTCRSPMGTDSSIKAHLDASGGSCAPFVATKQKDPVVWPNVLRLCSKPTEFHADGCAEGQLCVPDGPSPFMSHTCIQSQDDDATCPAPWTVKLTTFDDVDDTRDCSPTGCACSGVNGATCTGMMRNFTASTACTGASALVSIPLNTCMMVGGGSSQRVLFGSLKSTDGSCTPSGSPTPTGGLAGSAGRATVCCIP